MELLHVLDGYGYIFRAYYAMQGGRGGREVRLTTASGMPTAALHTYTNMLIRLYLDDRPQRIAVVFDAPGETFRNRIYPEYKATRREMPDELKLQIGLFRPITEAFSWPVLAVAGVEADDVIASVVRRARERGWLVRVYTGDKDLFQLVGEGVEVHDAMRQVRYDADEVERKVGVRPEQIRDYLAIMGDTSDNVPGLPGVGQKTAVELLAKYGSLEGIWAHVDELPTRPRKALADADKLAKLRLSRELVTLRTDVDFGVPLDDLVQQPWDCPRLVELFTQLEFQKHLGRLRVGMPEDARAALDAALAGAAVDAEITGEAAGEDGGDAAGQELGLGDAAAPPAPVEVPPPRVITTADALAALAREAREAGRISVHVETDGRRPDRAQPVGIAVGVPDRAPAYIPLSHRYLGAPAQLGPDALAPDLGAVLADPAVAVICHDAKETARALRRAGLALAGVHLDTMLAAYLLDSDRALSIERVLELVTGVRVPTRKQLLGTGRKRIDYDALSVDEAAAYAGAIAVALVGAERELSRRLELAGLTGLLRDVEQPLAMLLSRIEDVGITLDTDHLRALSARLGAQIAALEEQIFALAGAEINLGSPKQLSQLLFETLGLETEAKRRTATGFSTDHDVLDSLRDAHPVIASIIEHRELIKLKGTYLDALPPLVNPATGRLHTSFAQAVAATGRLSSQDPNLQNIPIRTEIGREIRRAFVAAEGRTLVSIDYSQIELRILAHLSQDPVLLRAFREGIDVHTQTAAEVFEIALDQVTPEQRRVAKAVNYGLVYGQSGFGLAQALGIARGEAQRYIARYFTRFARVSEFMDEVVQRARKTGYAVTVLGRRRPIADLRSKSAQRRKAAERVAQNTPVQGSAADIMKLAMLRVAARLDSSDIPAQILLTVHDELVFEVPPDRAQDLVAIARGEMESAYDLGVPLVTSVGIARSWADAHE